MDWVHYFLKVQVGVQLLVLALYVDGDLGEERQVAHVVPSIIYVVILSMFLARKYLLGAKETVSRSPKKAPGALHFAADFTRPFFYLAAAIFFCVHWPETCDNKASCWTGVEDGGTYRWWALAVLVLIPDVFGLSQHVYNAVSTQPQNKTTGDDEGANSVAHALLASKVHLY